MTTQATTPSTAPMRRATITSRERTTRLLLVGGVVGPLLFILVLLVEGATRPGYNAWRHFGSQLSLSDQGWEQIANFLVCGLLCLGFAIGLRRSLPLARGAAAGSIALAVFGCSLIVAGLFVTGPALGYPAGAGLRSQESWHSMLHGLAGFGAFGSLAVACFSLARRFAGDLEWRGWTLYSSVIGVVLIISFIASNATALLDMNGTWPNAPTGLIQRIGIVTGWTWVALLAARQLGTLRARTRDAANASE